NNLEKNLKDLEPRIKELKQSYERFLTQIKYLEEKVREREEEAKAEQEIIEEKS
ncbi:6238_t:CDS:2, partial [Funneliformis mosseae]